MPFAPVSEPGPCRSSGAWLNSGVGVAITMALLAELAHPVFLPVALGGSVQRPGGNGEQIGATDRNLLWAAPPFYTERQRSRRVRARGLQRPVGCVPPRGAKTYDAAYIDAARVREKWFWVPLHDRMIGDRDGGVERRVLPDSEPKRVEDDTRS